MRFEVDTSQVGEAVSKLQSALNGVSGERSKMFRSLEELDGMWVGEAHDSFAIQYIGDNQDVLTLISEIQSVIDNISKAGQLYDRCEQAAEDMISAISI